MDKFIQKYYVEIVLFILLDEECWYLLLFGVYYLKKFNKIGLVFDLLLKCEGQFLNDVFLFGLDLINLLLGVLMRFCREEMVIMVDVEWVFYCF